MGRGTGESRKGLSKVDRYGGIRMTAVTPQTNAPTGGAKARPAKSNKSAAGEPSPIAARSMKKSAKTSPKKAASRKAAPKKASPKKAARSTKSAGSNKTQNRTASRHKVTAKE